jgi:hypothetical protein
VHPAAALGIPSEVEVQNGASGTSDMDGCAAKAAAREPGDERVKSPICQINRFIFRDNPKWLPDWKEFPDASVDLIYLNRPFNSNADYDFRFSLDDYLNETSSILKVVESEKSVVQRNCSRTV